VIYINQEQLEDARNAIAFQVPIARVAAHLGVSAEVLRSALGLPALKPIPQDEEPRIDLFADIPEATL